MQNNNKRMVRVKRLPMSVSKDNVTYHAGDDKEVPYGVALSLGLEFTEIAGNVEAVKEPVEPTGDNTGDDKSKTEKPSGNDGNQEPVNDLPADLPGKEQFEAHKIISVEVVKGMTEAQLLDVPGIQPKVAKSVIAYFKK